jgi:CHAD domain-containing protein
VPIAELELEHKGGPAQCLFDLAFAWVQHGGLWLSTISKAQRGERLLQADGQSFATKSQPPRLPRDADGPALMRAMLQSTLEQVLANASDVAEGPADAETIHQLRVGLRRLRTVLHELAALAPALPADWDRALAAAFGKLGQRRDQEVVSAAVRPLLTAVSAPQLSWSRRSAPDPVAVVRAAAFQATLISILALAHADRQHFAPLSSAGTRKLIARRLEALHRKLVQEGERFERLPAEAQHRARKRLKRLRYLCEMIAVLWPRRATRRYLQVLGEAQDALGHHNDVCVAAAAFRAEAIDQPEAWFAAGYLLAHQAVTAQASGKALRRVADVDVFWR